MLENARKIYNEYPRAFWVYNIIVFIDRLGGFMLYPFFALYLTQKYDIGMTTVGILFAIFSVSGFVGSALGGALTDRMGRKGVIIGSLVLSSISALGMGFAPTLGIFIAVTVIVGTLFRPIAFGDSLWVVDHASGIPILVVCAILTLTRKRVVHRILVPVVLASVLLDTLTFSHSIG